MTPSLTPRGRVMHGCVSKLTIIGLDNGLSPARRQANNVNWALRNKLQWSLDRNYYIFIQEIAFENVVWEMAAILSRPQCVNLILSFSDRLLTTKSRAVCKYMGAKQFVTAQYRPKEDLYDRSVSNKIASVVPAIMEQNFKCMTNFRYCITEIVV